jgi:hypothetical protein
LRLKTLHSLQIFFTDALTFMAILAENYLSSLVLASEGDSAPGQVVGRKLHRHPVARKNLDKMHPHLTGYVGQHPVAVIEFHEEHGVRQRLDDRSFYLNRLFFRHKS